ncbi:MAG: triose-phosphate isomerase [Candidatus Methylarchaceae archaeon HK02M2]|nr:triose-phosphate isomerase [Candidatus Methylarchaceae archaeon HK02M2]
MLRTPLLLINFKNYLRASGEGAIKLAKIAESVAKELEVEIAVAPPIPDLSNVARYVDIPVFAQHIDLSKPGSTTGAIVSEVVKTCGGSGTLLNHSEKRTSHSIIEEMINKLRVLGMCIVVCAKTPNEVRDMAMLLPDFVAVEPPELIGTGRAVSKVKPEVISKSVKAISEVSDSVKLICGAGITSGEDVEIAIKLGSVGVLVASSIVQSYSWELKIRELAKPLAPK